ncbi:MAG: NIPSNAP family protein [Solirubrobacterales bacterium]|nr:NIPSNAP family protein [Solirubrobacterales bacterium]
MDHQLRIYKLKEGRLEDFLTLWREHVVPARAACGFEVVASYVNREERELAWIVRHTGEGGFEAGDARYYASAERAALPWDPREAIASAELRMLEVYNP